MYAATGISLLTVLALLAGLFAHSLKQLIAARRNQVQLTPRQYVLGCWPETMLGTMTAIVFWLGQPEIVSMFPDVARQIGFGSSQSILSSFAVGFIGNSLADFLGGRARAIAGTA